MVFQDVFLERVGRWSTSSAQGSWRTDASEVCEDVDPSITLP